ncbi:hypothetical protein [Microcoleus sp. FACHB-672]|uniref:hypothetical protein n=1 Tax=Microcoleus sp. FACHB-672 TaxID=2692825 RepID=UPI0019A4A250|nr:hypothetical protein [Microcoleus sp. FACHB-672]MBD2043389.1 hypothetical protein [Microcoleus sp. FACHB-672]
MVVIAYRYLPDNFSKTGLWFVLYFNNNLDPLTAVDTEIISNVKAHRHSVSKM